MPATISIFRGQSVLYNCCLTVSNGTTQAPQLTSDAIQYRISSRLVNINLNSFCHHTGPRARGAQQLHQQHTNHPVLFNSFSPHHKRLEPSSDCHHLSNFTPVILEPAWWQPPQPAANSQSLMPMNPALCK